MVRFSTNFPTTVGRLLKCSITSQGGCALIRACALVGMNTVLTWWHMHVDAVWLLHVSLVSDIVLSDTWDTSYVQRTSQMLEDMPRIQQKATSHIQYCCG